ncbi:5'-methylthioadenosine/adenosylhomocysteine nucleosidase [Lacticaseibacillus mingshuiensis]|uniref:5'-methylthioadenosine/S-adenosylhomocysteine nucleosidase n=1 Tax=Lacticaseibacillus mingshuiensis TaxID=2799574 RepID=A0ABW4CM97_9LACO|nr:5'-methylthioadenosine/adenosylhomocysteine nucleosidase [Lacticaseibacillus mingshuiensis]
MKLGIICAMEEEIRTLVNQLTDRQETLVAGQRFYSGRLAGHEVALVESGIGKVQAALTAAVLLEVFKPDLLINTGSAGGIGEGLAIGDVVISEAVAYHDVDATAFGYLPGQLPQQPQKFEADAAAVSAIVEAARDVALTTHVGLIVSGDQFIASKDAIAKILAIYPDALASEMEGAAIGQVAHQFGVPFVIIRAMSDVGDESASVNFDDFIIDAGKQSAQMLLAYLKQH